MLSSVPTTATPSSTKILATPLVPAFSTNSTTRFNFPNVVSRSSPVLVNIDADGDLDAFIGNEDGYTFFFENTGSAANAAYAPSSARLALPTVPSGATPTFADIDGDGDLDQFIGDFFGNILFLENTGSASNPAFAAGRRDGGIPDVGYRANPVFADIDGDGDLDLFVGNSSGCTFFFANTGNASSPAFAASSLGFGLPNVGNATSPALADIDGDGDLDLFIGNQDGSTLFFRNTGTGGVNSTTANGSYVSGNTITIKVLFSDIVTVTGSPTLQLETGSTDQVATYTSGSGTNILSFSYTVQAADSSADLDYTSASALDLNGGTIKDAAGNSASLTLAAPGAQGSLGANAALVIIGPDLTAPAAPTGLDLSAGSDTGSSSTDNLTSLSTPTISGSAEALSTVVLYDTDGTTSLGSTTADANGAWSITTSTLSAGSHTLTAKASDAATNTSTASASLDLTVDTAAASIIAITTTNSDGTYTVGDTITIKVQFSEALIVTGTPRLQLETGTSDQYASYASLNTTDLIDDTITFSYTVQAGDSSLDLDQLSTTALDLNSGTIKDAAGNNATLTLAAPGAAGSLGVNAALVIDTAPAGDTTAPDAPTGLDLSAGSDSGSSSTDNLTSLTTPTISGSAEALSTVILYDTDSTTSLGSTTADANGAWSITTATLAAGTHSLTAVATDTASNTSGSSSILAITVDNNDPKVDIGTAAPPFSAGTVGFGLPDLGYSASPTFADIDDDGDLDLFIGSSSGNTYFFENTGNATNPAFAESSIAFGIPDVGYNINPTLADINTDGDLDLFIGNSNGVTLFFENTGNANSAAFAGSSIGFGLADVGDNASPVFADIDADGDLDLFIGNSNGSTLFFINTGAASSPAFAGSSIAFGLPDVGNWASPTLADIDTDGDLDLFIGGADGNTYFFSNTGSASSAAFARSSIAFGIPDVGYEASPRLADIDADGDLDLFLGDGYGNILFFENTRSGGLTSTNADDTYGLGDTITIKVPFSEVVTVDTTDGTPTLLLETGSSDQVATYTTGSGTNTLTFTYTVQGGDTSVDLDYNSGSALELNGGTIQDAAGNNASLSLPAPGAAGSLGVNAALVIDGSASLPVEAGDDGSDPSYESSQGDFNGDGVNDDSQTYVATFSTSEGPTSLAIKDPVVNQVVSDLGGSVVATTQLHFNAATTDASAASGLQLSIDLGNVDSTVEVSAVSDLLSFTITPTVTSAGDVSDLDVDGIKTSAVVGFQATIQEVELYFQESRDVLGTITPYNWNALYKTRKAQNNSIEYYLFNYDPLTGLGGILLDRDGNGLIDGANLYLKDGELGDFDETPNGQIVDPIGFTTLDSAPVLRITADQKGLTVEGVEGTGLWLSLDVTGFNSLTQGNLELYNASTGDSYGAIGATLGSGPTGGQSLYLASGSTLNFRYSNGAGQSNNNPALSISSTAGGFSLGLDADLNGIYTDLMLDISSSLAASSGASLAMARKQLTSSDTILDLTNISASGITLSLDISTDCGLHNRFGFVKIDPLTGTTYQVAGVSQNDGAAFRSAVLSQWINPYDGSGTSHLYNKSRQTITWNLDSTESGYYAPVMITQGGEVLTFGANTASDGRQHVKLLGTNTFGFEDLLASQGSDWDFNDTKIWVSVV
ncbi:MAG: FG-GAP-like repeat-containing protein [Cyanobacteria bacterium]|nr:FG-GAP-like repeat-containing protein [Cyanobacteriota bacterium]